MMGQRCAMERTAGDIHVTPIDLHPTGEQSVFVYPKDYEHFAMSQGEAVEALRANHEFMTVTDIMRRRSSELFVDIAKWGAERERVERIVLTNRPMDTLVIVIASDEDESGDLHDEMADLDLKVHDGYENFRLQFILLRASEADGLESFADPDQVMRLYPSAKS